MSSIASTIPLKSQVGGHAGVLTTEDGSLLIKPALPLELKFYQSLQSDSGFAPLRPFIPTFYGILKLEGKVDESLPSYRGATITAIEGQKDECLISNSARCLPFSHNTIPCFGESFAFLPQTKHPRYQARNCSLR